MLEGLAKGHSLDDILTRITQITEHQMPGMIASFLLYDPISKCLHHGISPNLPDAYTEAIDGLRIGERVGPCGTAAHQGKPVIVDDIESDPRWEVFRDIALKYNLRSCWSHPIICTEGRLLGTFAMYYKIPHAPQPSDLDLIREVAKLAAIAINGKHQENALHSIAAGTASVTGSEFLRSLVHQISVAIHVNFAMLTEWKDQSKNIVRTLVFRIGNDFVENIEYDLAGTPCEDVLAGNMSFYPKDIQTLFPRDTMLVELNVNSYVGLPLFDSSGKVIGHIAVLDKRSISTDPREMSILRISAARAGAELERRQAVLALRDANANSEKRVAERTADLLRANVLLKQEI